MTVSELRSQLFLPAIRASVRLGWQSGERAVPQDVLVDVALDFATAPAAVQSDDLADTIDCAWLSEQVTRVGASGEYRLLERLAQCLYSELRGLLASDIGLWLQVAKARSPLAAMEHGARFALGDAPTARSLPAT